MKGGASGPVVIAKDADGSPLIKKVVGGSHPGQFSADELNIVKAWIAAGATETAQGGAPPAAAPAAGSKATFVKDIQPIFTIQCAACHGTMGELTLTSYESVMHGGTSGPAVTPKDPDKSSIIKKMTAGGHPGQLSPEEIELVRKWIADGAPE
jgi:mono/diheme cytochrome c family protein